MPALGDSHHAWTEVEGEVSSMSIGELELKKTILDRFDCNSTFRGAVAIREPLASGGTFLSVTVFVFDLTGHPTASRCYVWSSVARGSDRGEYVTVLHDETVDSARAAVRAYALQKEEG